MSRAHELAETAKAGYREFGHRMKHAGYIGDEDEFETVEHEPNGCEMCAGETALEELERIAADAERLAAELADREGWRAYYDRIVDERAEARADAERYKEIVAAAYAFADGPCAMTDEWHRLCSLTERLTDADLAALEASG